MSRDETAPGPAHSGFVMQASGVGYRYPAAAQLAVADVGLDISSGEVVSIVGPNGSGKSTLLKLLTGALPPTSGSVTLWNQAVQSWSPRRLARRLAVVTQREAPAFPVRVRDLVASGRYAHLGAFRSERPVDAAVIEQALGRCGISHLAQRSVRELSGGEFQRARLARALAQEPEIVVLDEPTAALDVRYQMALLELLRDLGKEQGLTVLFVTHRLELAARFADRLLLLGEGRVVREGTPRQVLEAATLSDVYGWPLAVVDVDIAGAGSVLQVVPLPGPTSA